MPNILRAVKGGYNKKDVLTKIDAYMSLLLSVQSGMPQENALAELERIKQMPLTVEKEGFFAKTGFSQEDTDAYLAEMEDKITSAFEAE